MAVQWTMLSLYLASIILFSKAYQDDKSLRPNIVFILVDDLGYNDIGYHAVNGMSGVKTPHMDSLAAEGVTLENYYVQPMCSPSRSALMTGRYPIRYGLQHQVIKAAQPTCLPLSETTLADKLKEIGYTTHAIGKWHLGYCRTECLPMRRGFDSFFGYAVGGTDHYVHNKTVDFNNIFDDRKNTVDQAKAHTSYHLKEHVDNERFLDKRISDGENYGADIELEEDERFVKDIAINRIEEWNGKDLWENETVTWKYEEVYSTTLFTEKSQETIERHDPKKPLFLYLAYKNVHAPLQAPKLYMDMFEGIDNYDRRSLAAMAYIVDEGVKNVTDTLKKKGMWDNTVLIVSSDNGGSLTNAGNNWPLRGGKTTLWEGGIRAVGFVHSPLLPRHVKGTVNYELMHVSDWFPTLVEGIAGGSTAHMTKPLDGINQWEMISEGGQSNRGEILLNIDELEAFPQMETAEYDYWQTNLNEAETLNPLLLAGIRNGDWKLLTGNTGSDHWRPPHESGMATQDLRDTSSECTPEKSVVKLFNVKLDPSETCNLARNPDFLPIAKALFNKLRSYADQAVPAYYPPEDPMANPALRGGAWGPWLDNDLEILYAIN